MFFYYRLFIQNLVGSENPSTLPQNKSFVKCFAARHKVSDLITLSRFQDKYDVAGLRQHHFPCDEKPTDQQLEAIFKIIDRALVCQRAVWIHCERGYDRTGYVLRMYHLKRGYLQGEVNERFEERVAKRFRRVSYRQ